jgi:DNA primase
MMLNQSFGFKYKSYLLKWQKEKKKVNFLCPVKTLNINRFVFHKNIICGFKISLCKVIIQHEIELIKRGKSYVALCPFHNEKTPSFYVNDEKNIYHCFGCGKSGNVESFIKEIKKKKKLNNFYRLPGQLNTNIHNFNNMYKGLNLYSERTHLFEFSNLILIQIANNYYEKLVQLNVTAKIYFYTRGISPLTSKIYKLGYSNISKETLFKLFCNFYVNKEKTLETGLIHKKSGVFYDIFQNRIMIPIMDQKGLIIGFGGRLVIDTKFPKYLNSSDSPVFKKSRCSYSEYSFVNINIQKPKIGILVEGYMDSIVLVQNGIRFSLASMGTGISKYYLQRTLILNQNKHVLFCFDGDISGKNAAKKNFLNLSQKIKKKEFKISISIIKEFKDPDEFSYYKGGFDFTEDIINSTKPGILWIENFCDYFHEDLTYYINIITIEVIIVLVRMFNGNTLTKHINLFLKIFLKKKFPSKLSTQYFFNRYILYLIKINEEIIISNRKKNSNFFENKSSIELLESDNISKKNLIIQKKVFFFLFL